MSVRRSLSVVALAALAAGAFAAPGQAAEPLVHSRGALTDLQPGTTHPTDGARAFVSAWETSRGTTVVLHVRGLDPDHAGRTLGAHVHVGHCVAGAPLTAGPHLKVDAAPPSPRNEVWLDFRVEANGTGYAIAHVPFTIGSDAAHSVVVHEHETHDDGNAGARLACLPAHF